jgi:hypothetical protein
LSELARKCHELGGIKPLVAEENDLVLEEGRANLASRDLAREVDAEDLGAERAGDFPNPYCSTLMFASRMILP